MEDLLKCQINPYSLNMLNIVKTQPNNHLWKWLDNSMVVAASGFVKFVYRRLQWNLTVLRFDS